MYWKSEDNLFSAQEHHLQTGTVHSVIVLQTKSLSPIVVLSVSFYSSHDNANRIRFTGIRFYPSCTGRIRYDFMIYPKIVVFGNEIPRNLTHISLDLDKTFRCF